MKSLDQSINNFDPASWEMFASNTNMAIICQYAKVSQNESLKEYLLATDHKILMGAAPKEQVSPCMTLYFTNKKYSNQW